MSKRGDCGVRSFAGDGNVLDVVLVVIPESEGNCVN